LRYGLWRPRILTMIWRRRSRRSSRPAIRAIISSSKSRRRAILYQNRERFFDADLTKPDQLVHVLDLFFGWRPPAFDVWEKAIEEFKGRVQSLARTWPG